MCKGRTFAQLEKMRVSRTLGERGKTQGDGGDERLTDDTLYPSSDQVHELGV
jgi:hypothetical protein